LPPLCFLPPAVGLRRCGPGCGAGGAPCGLGSPRARWLSAVCAPDLEGACKTAGAVQARALQGGDLLPGRPGPIRTAAEQVPGIPPAPCSACLCVPGCDDWVYCASMVAGSLAAIVPIAVASDSGGRRGKSGERRQSESGCGESVVISAVCLFAICTSPPIAISGPTGPRIGFGAPQTPLLHPWHGDGAFGCRITASYGPPAARARPAGSPAASCSPAATSRGRSPSRCRTRSARHAPAPAPCPARAR